MLQRTLDGFGLPTLIAVGSHESDTHTCGDCDCVVENSEWNEELKVCKECEEDYFACCECEESFHINTMESSSSELYCETCYDQTHFRCNDCGDYFHNEEETHSESGESYCNNCYSEHYISCESCYCEVHYEDSHNGYCSECAQGEEWEPAPWVGTNAYNSIGSRRKFGIELESSACDGYVTWAKDTGWGAKEDGSIDGMEFVSPPMWGNDGYNSVKQFCKLANTHGVRVNHKCGYHLHIDLSDTTSEQRKAIALAYHYTRKVWDKFVHPDRRDTYYAQHSTGSRRHGEHWDRDKILAGNDKPGAFSRYVWLNWSAFDRHETVEVRSHEATFDGEEVLNWVKAHTKFVDYVRTMSVGEITRTFGGEDETAIMRELSYAWNEEELISHYRSKMEA